MLRIFNRKAKAPSFEGDLIPENDPVFEMMRVSSVARGLLSINGDSNQRIYRAKVSNLALAFSGRVHIGLMNAAAFYHRDDDAILLSRDPEKGMHQTFSGTCRVFNEIFLITHELTHRYQNHHESFNIQRQFANGYEHIAHTLLSEMHARNITDIILMQIAKQCRQQNSDIDFVESCEQYFINHCLENAYTEYLSAANEDIKGLGERVFHDSFDEHLQMHDHYIQDDHAVLKHNASVFESMGFMSYIFAAMMAPISAFMYVTDNAAAAVTVSLVSAGLAVTGYKAGQGKKSLSIDNESEIDFARVFDLSSAGQLPQDDPELNVFFEANDNDPLYIDKAIDMQAKIQDVVSVPPFANKL